MMGGWLGVVLVGVVWGPVALASDAEFDPREHFPADPLLYLRVADSAELWSGMRATLPGRFLENERVRRAFAGTTAVLTERLAAAEADLLARMGFDPRTLVRDFSGEIVLTVQGLGPGGAPDLLLALEADGDPGAAADRLVVQLASALGAQAPENLVADDGAEFSSLSTPLGSVDVAVIGRHVVLVTQRARLGGIRQRLAAVAPQPSLGRSQAHLELEQVLGSVPDQIRVAVDVAMLSKLVLPLLLSGVDRDERARAVHMSGIESITTFGKVLSMRDGSVDATMRLGSDGNPTGLVGALLRSFPPSGAPVGAFAVIPRDALAIGVWCFDPGPLRELLADPPWQEVVSLLAERLDTGDLTAETSALEPIEVWSFAIDPPAGSLLPDSCLLVRTHTLEPYWNLCADWVETKGAVIETLPVGDEMLRYLGFTSGALSDARLLRTMIEGTAFDGGSELVMALTGLSGLSLFSGAARADLPGGWSVLSSSTHAVERYLTSYRHDTDAPLSAVMQRARRELTGASGGSVSVTGRTLLSAYNTLLAVAQQQAALLGQLGVDVAWLPPAESFADTVTIGSTWMRADEHGLTLRVQGGLLTSAGPLALAGVGLFALGVGPQISTRSQEAKRVVTRTKGDTVIAPALDDYRRHHGHYPETLDGLLQPSERNFGQPYLRVVDIRDPWELPYEYERLAAGRYALRSLGADGLVGGEGADADIVIR